MLVHVVTPTMLHPPTVAHNHACTLHQTHKGTGTMLRSMVKGAITELESEMKKEENKKRALEVAAAASKAIEPIVWHAKVSYVLLISILFLILVCLVCLICMIGVTGVTGAAGPELRTSPGHCYHLHCLNEHQ